MLLNQDSAFAQHNNQIRADFVTLIGIQGDSKFIVEVCALFGDFNIF